MVRRITVLSVAVILAAALNAAAQTGRESVPEAPLRTVPYPSAQQQSISSRTIEVTGNGQASAKPDTMMVSFMLTNKADSSAECMRVHAGKMRKIIDALKAKLGSGAKIATSQFSLSPNYTYGPAVASKPEASATPLWDCKIEIVAYAQRIGQLGALIDAGMAAGASSVVGSGFLFLPQSSAAASTSRSDSFAVPGAAVAMERTPGTVMPAVTLEVERQGSTAEQATRSASAIAAKVEEVFKQKLQGKGHVRSSQFSITPISRNSQLQGQPTPHPPERSRITSWIASTMITARTRDLSILGPLIETGMKAGATGLNSVTFTLKEGNSAREQALENASADAKRKAATVARSMGVKLGNILKITTNAYAQPQVVYGRAFLGQESRLTEGRPMPVMPHEIGYSATVNVTYQIK